MVWKQHCAVWPFLTKMKQWRSFGKVRSCVMFGPHHSRTSLKILAFIFSWKNKNKNPPSEKGAVNACYILHCSERSVIASSFWEMHCRKLVPRLYQESSTSFSNTELILSEMVLVKLSTTLSSADASSQIAFFFSFFFQVQCTVGHI